MAEVAVLDVRLHGRSIGALTRLGRERIVFGFDPGYVDDPDRATLSLSFRDPFGGVVTDFAPTRRWAHPFFSNLLPEGSLREYLARAAGIDPQAEFELLAALGEDLPGAVTTVPLDVDAEPGPASGGAGAGHDARHARFGRRAAAAAVGAPALLGRGRSAEAVRGHGGRKAHRSGARRGRRLDREAAVGGVFRDCPSRSTR